MKEEEIREFHYVVSPSDAERRLDSYLSLASHLSRSQTQKLILEGRVRVDGKAGEKDHRVKAGEAVTLSLPAIQPSDLLGEAIPLQILFEDDSIIVVNKEPGIVVHPAPGHPSGTLVHALLHHCPDLGGIGGALRPGIVHRLDKDTSGVLIMAKTDEALHHLSQQFKSRKVRKRYLALVLGRVDKDQGEVEAPVGRLMGDRKKMGVRTQKGRAALTRYLVRERFPDFTLLEVTPETGRTHQIRVHLAHIGHPVWGDPVYGGRKKNLILQKTGEELIPRRQMLHAWRLGFAHPRSKEPMSMEAPLPADFQEVLKALQSGFSENLREDKAIACTGSRHQKAEG
jgi:23S rRNA pseudouridine1911/1915/1917 synthase